MRTRTTRVVNGVALGVLAGSAWLGALSEVGAQSALCPPVVIPPDDVRVPASRGGFVPIRDAPNVSVGGYCTNDAGAFSGAALASQALTELSQSTTQETTRTTGNAIVERREVERQRCAEGFTRVNGVCEPTAPRVAEPVVAAEPVPVKEPLRKKAVTPKAEAVAGRKPAARPVSTVRVALPPQPPVFVEPEARFGAWTQVVGDYERRSATGLAVISALANGQDFAVPGAIASIATVPLALSISSRSSTIGFQVGSDITTRDVLVPGDGIIIGGFAGYVSSDLSLSSTAASAAQNLVQTGTSSVRANLAGATTGLYATYFSGPFSADLLLKVDALTLNQSLTETFAYAPGFLDFGSITGPWLTSFSSRASTNLLNGTVAGNFNYRFDLYPTMWIEPTVGAAYTSTSYGANAVTLGLSDGALLMVQGGARFGNATLLDNKVLLTTTLTGLAYSNVSVSGGFIPGAGFLGNNILAQADEGQVRGRGILAFNFDFGQGIKSFVLGEVRGGNRLEW
jgi:hypothetical protein